MKTQANILEPKKPESIQPYAPETPHGSEPTIDDEDLPPGTPPRAPDELPGKDNLEHTKRHVG